MKKGFLLGLMVGLVIACATFVFANSQIQAILNDQIKVSLDGEIQVFKDETTGETQYPITYNDRTYLPLRTIANLVNVGVDYDASTKTAILTTAKNTNVPKKDQIGTAGSNIPLKDNNEEAKYQIEVAMQELLKEAYGDKVFDARFYVEKIYTAEEEANIPELKERNLGPDEVAFEIKYEIKPAVGVDPNIFTAATGTYDEETGWVKEKYNLGILRPNEAEFPEYKITDFGTGW